MPAAPAASTTARNAQVVIAVILAGAALRAMADIITPLLLAVFLAVMIDGFARVIQRHASWLGAGGALAAAILGMVGAFAACGLVVGAQAGAFAAGVVKAEPKINAGISAIARLLHVRGPGSVDHMLRHLDPVQYVGAVANAVETIASNAVFVLVYLGFLLAARQAFGRKAVRLFETRESRQNALAVFLRVRDGVERYLWIQTVTGLIIAAGSWGLMMLIGLDNALFWAFLIFAVNYVPIFGAAAAIVLPALFGLAQFDGYWRALALLAGLWAITFVVGNILLPRMQGDSLNLDPLVVMLSLAFWGSIWGLTGMFLSTPLTVLVMVILAQFPGSRWIAVLLSADGDPQGLGRGYGRSPDQPDAAAAEPA